MSTKYLWSGATGAGTGADFTNAYTTLTAAIAGLAAGDLLYIADDHSESTGGVASWTFPGTVASPNFIICVARADSSISTGATFSTGTGNFSMTVLGSFYAYGVTFSGGGGANNNQILTLGGGTAVSVCQFYDTCVLDVAWIGAGARLALGTTQTKPIEIVFKNSTVKFAATGQGINLASDFAWDGGSFETGSSAITALFKTIGNSGRGARATISGVDLSAAAAAFNFTDAAVAASVEAEIIARDCKMPASWSGGLASGAFTDSGIVGRLDNCAADGTNYIRRRRSYAGTIVEEATIVRNGGASDGTTNVSWKMTTNTGAKYPHVTLSDDLVQWNDSTGGAVTATVEVVHDSQGSGTSSRLTDAEAWLEVMVLDTSGSVVGTWRNDAKASYQATAADQADSTDTWTTTGLTTPLKQKLAVTFTPQVKGYIVGRVHLAKASSVIYVDPKMTVA